MQLDHEHAAGSFAFHPNHNHWHFQGLARYELAEMKPDGTVGEVVEGASSRQDRLLHVRPTPDRRVAQRRPRYPAVFRIRCDENDNVGYSVGWGDEYPYNFAEQDIDITGVPPGEYWVVSKADPEGLVRETNNRTTAPRPPSCSPTQRSSASPNTTSAICRPCGRTGLTTDKRFKIKGSTDPVTGLRNSRDRPLLQAPRDRRLEALRSPGFEPAPSPCGTRTTGPSASTGVGIDTSSHTSEGHGRHSPLRGEHSFTGSSREDHMSVR